MWVSWQNTTSPNRKEKLQKLSVQESFHDVSSELKQQTPTLLMHHLGKEKQSAAFKNDHDFQTVIRYNSATNRLCRELLNFLPR